MREERNGPDPEWEQDPGPDGFDDDVLELSTNTVEPDSAQAELDTAREQLEYHADAMAVIETWRNELRTKLARARLTYELIGLSDEEHDELRAEVARFKEIAALLRLVREASK
jgi:hypothetical protein